MSFKNKLQKHRVIALTPGLSHCMQQMLRNISGTYIVGRCVRLFFGSVCVYVFCTYIHLNAIKAVHFKHTYLKITRGTEWRIVEGFAAVRFAESYVLVHPNGLALTVGGQWKY